jgi:hypothetical protein
MATTSLMIQLYTEQFYDSVVTDVPALEDEAYLFLDPTKAAVVREIATEEYGGIVLSEMYGLTLGYANTAFTELNLISPKGDINLTFYAPSHVPSPPVAGTGLATLRVRQTGVVSKKGAKIALDRAVGAHAYVDQND